MTVGEGERLHNERRRRFWRVVLTLAAVGGLAGFVSGFIHGRADATGEPIGATTRAIAMAAVAVAMVGGAIASWRFFQAADEVEITDNLWASLIGFYVYGFGFPAWWALSLLQVVPEPDQFIIYGAAIVSAAAAYGVRKWRSR